MFELVDETGIFKVYVQPGSKTTGVVGLFDDRLKLKLNAPPVDGKANKELLRFFSEWLSVPVTRLEITHGFHDRRKTVKVLALSAIEAQRILDLLASDERLLQQGTLF